MLSKKDWETELKAAEAARDAMLRSHLINKRIAELIKEEIKNAPLRNNKGDKTVR